MIKIGNKELVFSQTFLIPKSQEVWFTTNISGWNLKVKIDFKEGKKQEIKVLPVEDYANIILINWNSSLGTALVEPGLLGSHNDGRKLYFMCSNFRIGETNKFDIQLLLGGAE